MLYDFTCVKATCGRSFDVPMSLERYEKLKAMDPPFYEVTCPMCGTKAPKRSAPTPLNSPVVHRDFGEWNPRTAPEKLVGRSWNSKDEKEAQVKEVLGSNFVVGETDRDKTVKPFNPQAEVVTESDVKDGVTSSGPMNLRGSIIMAIEIGKPFRVAELAKQIGADYRAVYGKVRALKGIEKVGKGEFVLRAA